MAGEHLYVIQSAVTGAVKVGRSGAPDRRLLDLQVGSPHRLRLILLMLDAGDLEKKVHRAMVRYRTRQGDGEWFHEAGLGSIPDEVWGHTLPWYREDPDWWKRR